MITAPGIFRDMSSAEYFGDPCEAPSLTQSVAKILLDQSPLHAWHAHPRLNPDYRHDDDTKFDVGNIAHKLLIGRGKDLLVLKFDDWRTSAAKITREQAAKDGKLAVLGKHHVRAQKMVDAAREQLDLRGLSNLFSPKLGAGEVVVAWQEDVFWLRQMVDWLSDDCLIFADYKTTDMSAAPHGLGRMMVNAGWPIQAAMGARGLDAVDPQNFGRRKFLFIVQEASAPYALNVVEIGRDALTMGAKMLEHAAMQWKWCMSANRWPGYPQEIITPEYPGWAESAWLEREIHEAGSARINASGREPMLSDLSGG